MAGPAPQSQSQTYTSAEDEALKRNTDCIYFLASPLTCKKGNECEFRHSDVARLNPRDCFFWLNGNCLNSKCAFRHPPLDGLLSKETTPTASSLPNSSTTVAHHPSASGKQAVACVFFQSGYCVKGDWCPFLHAPPNFILNTAPLKPGAASAAEPVTSTKAFKGSEKFAQEEKSATTNNNASNKGPLQVKLPVAKAVPVLTRNEFAVTKRMPPTSDVNEFSYRNVLSGSSGNSHAQPPHLLDEPAIFNNKDSEEISREHSPGFDVLVDDETIDDEYYPSQDQYAMSKEREVGNDYDAGRSTDYNKNDINKRRFQDPLGYDSREHFKGQHSWEDRASSQRIPEGPSYLERRPYPRVDTHVEVDELDLRHRLRKHKKANGLRSVISREHSNDRHANDRTYQGTLREDRHVNRQENSRGSRLQGRITLPERPSQNDRSVDRHRSPTVRSTMSSHVGRVGGRIQDRAEAAVYNSGRNNRGMQSRSDIMDANFSGPKSLAELKKRKSSENNEADKRNVQRSRLESLSNQQALGKRKHSIPDNNQQSGNGLSFEGPKPLHEILKRKKAEATEAPNGCNLFNNEVNNQNEGLKAAENEILEHNQPDDSMLKPVSDFEAEEGMIVVEEEEPEAYEQAIGESEEDLGLYEGENGDDEELEYYEEEEEEDDDFAKKMGVKYA